MSSQAKIQNISHTTSIRLQSGGSRVIIVSTENDSFRRFVAYVSC